MFCMVETYLYSTTPKLKSGHLCNTLKLLQKALSTNLPDFAYQLVISSGILKLTDRLLVKIQYLLFLFCNVLNLIHDLEEAV